MGTQLNRRIRSYELVQRIGKGGFGEVYRAYQSTIGREVAIKVIMPQYANRPEFVRNFESEAKTIARLEHPFIVPLFDYWREPDGAYLVMRFLRGGTLKDEMTDGAMPLERVADVLDNVCSALWTAHRNRVAHRDIKPANIILDDEQRAYLSDFGLAITVGEDHFENLVGTWLYMPPERIKSGEQSHTVDVYSLGIMTYQMLTGEYPFDRTTMQRLAQSHISQPLPPLQRYVEELPVGLDTVLQRATAKDHDARYNDIRLFAQQFREIALPMGSAGDRTVILPIYEEKMNPYMGLRPFTEADSAFFFGRTKLAEKLISRMTEDVASANFLAVVGPSGSGKSSVISAGLIPRLKAEGIQGSDKWFYTQMVPGQQPFQNLMLALRSVSSVAIEDITEQIMGNRTTLARYIPNLLGDHDATLLLFIDQFEEVFTQLDDEKKRQEFLDLITGTIGDPESRVKIIITIRADFYDRPLRYEAFGKLIQERTEVILPLDTSELERVIVGPAKEIGVDIEPELIAEIISDVKSEPGALPLLQYTLTEMFHRSDQVTLTLASYHESGGIRGSLARRADEVYKSIPDSHRRITHQIFLRLVTLGEGTEDTRRRVHLSELQAISDDPELVDVVLKEFNQYRLLTFDRDPETREPTVEVAHEALIREWKQFRMWLDASRNDLRLERLIATEVADWIDSGKDPSYLVRGNRLAHFEHWAESTNIAVSAQEVEFIRASIEEQQREKLAEQEHLQLEMRLMKQSRQRWRLIVVMLLIGTAGVIAGVFAIYQKNQEIERQLTSARSSTLSTIARQAASAGDNELALSFAREAFTLSPDSNVTYETLKEISYAPGLRKIINPEIESPVYELALSANGQLALKASGTNYTKLIDSYLSDTQRARASSFLFGKPPDFASLDFDAIPPSIIEVVDVVSGTILTRFDKHTSTVTDIGFIPVSNGRSSPELAYSVSILGEALIWDIVTGEIVQTITFPVGYNRLSITNDGRFLLNTSGSRFKSEQAQIILWDISSNTLKREYALQARGIWDSAIGGDGEVAVSAYLDGTQIAWDITTGEVIGRFVIDDAIEVPHYTIALSQDGKTVVSSSGNGDVYIWETDESDERSDVSSSTNVLDIALADDGSTLVLLYPDDYFEVQSLTGEQLNELWEEQEGIPLAVDIDSTGNTAVFGLEDGTTLVWDLQDFIPDLVQEFSDFNRNLYATFGPTVDDSETILVFDGEFEPEENRVESTLSIWRIDDKKLIAEWESTHNLYPEKVIVDPNANYAMTLALPDLNNQRLSHLQQRLILWDLNTYSVIKEILPASRVYDIMFIKNGEKFLSAGEKNVTLWDVNGVITRVYEASGNVLHVAVDDALEYVFGTSDDGLLIQWNYATGEVVATYPIHVGAQTLGILSEKSWVVAETENHQITIWDYATQNPEPIRILGGHKDQITAIEFVADKENEGNFIMATTAVDTLFFEWDLETFEQIGTTIYDLRIRDIQANQNESYYQITLDGGYIDILTVVIPDINIENYISKNRVIHQISIEDCQWYSIEELCISLGIADDS